MKYWSEKDCQCSLFEIKFVKIETLKYFDAYYALQIRVHFASKNFTHILQPTSKQKSRLQKLRSSKKIFQLLL